MDPKITTRDAFILMGVLESRKFGEPGFFDDLWSKHYQTYDEQVRRFRAEDGYYTAYIVTGVGKPPPVDILAGMAVRDVSEIPEGLAVRRFSPTLYATFDTTMKDLGKTWDEIYASWLPASGYEHSVQPDLEYFPPGTGGPDSPVQVWVAIQKKNDA